MHSSRFSCEAPCREAWSAEGLSDRTIQAYLSVLARAERFARGLGKELLELTATEIRELSATWPPTRASRIQLRVALARFWTVSGLSAPAGAVRVPRKPQYACRALSEPQAAALAAVARSDGSSAGLAVALGLYAGLRREEIARLRWAQVDLAAGWVVIFGKGDTTAELPIHADLTRLLARHPRQGAFVFPGARGREHVTPATVWLWCRRLSVAALGCEVAPHRLRHTAIATLNDATGDLRVAQAFARHRRIETTVLYTRVERSRLEQAVAALDYRPRAS